MNNLETLAQMILDPMQLLWGKVSAMIPNLVAALIMLVIGYLLAKAASFIVRKTLHRLGLDNLADRLRIHQGLKNMNIEKPLSSLLGMLAFLFIIVAFVLSSVETLGFERVSASIDQLLLYLPKVFAAALVMIIGLFVADLVRTGVRNATEGIGLDYGPALSRSSFGLVVVIVVMLAIDQLEIEIFLLNELIGIILFSVGVAVALSLGLGSRELSRQVVSGVYVRDLYQPGDTVEVAGAQGKLIEVGTVKSLLELKDGSWVSFSNQVLLDEMVTIKRGK